MNGPVAPTQLEKESDETLMFFYQEGNYDAFTELYQRYASKIYGYVISKVREPQLAQDLTQQVFLKIHKNRSRYQPEFPFTAWIFTITRNGLTDFYRKKKENLTLDLHSNSLQELPVESSSNDSSDGVSRWEGFQIETLTPEQQQLLTYRFQEGLTFEEMAVRLKSSSQTLRKKVSRLMAKMRKEKV